MSRCPNCSAVLVAGRERCMSCGMETAKMDALRKAKAAAAKRGLGTDVDDAPSDNQNAGRYIKYAAMLIVVVAVIGGLIALIKGNSTNPWEGYPDSKTNAVHALFEKIATDDRNIHRDAYNRLIARDAKPNPKSERHLDLHLQVFHDVHSYLAAEFGGDWLRKLTVEVDAKDDNLVIARVEDEKLHVRVSDQVPAEAKAKGEPSRYGVVQIAEFPHDEAGSSNQMGGITGVLNSVGAGGSANDLRSVLAAGANTSRETPMQTKRRILPILRRPNDAALKRMIIHAWMVREDPVVRRKLQEIVDGPQFSPEAKATADAVLKGTISEEELIAAGVTRTW